MILSAFDPMFSLAFEAMAFDIEAKA